MCVCLYSMCVCGMCACVCVCVYGCACLTLREVCAHMCRDPQRIYGGGFVCPGARVTCSGKLSGMNAGNCPWVL